MRDENRHQRDYDAEYDEHADQVTPCVGAAPFDEAHVVDEDQRSHSFRAMKHRRLNNVPQTLPQSHDRVAPAGRVGGAAPEGGRIGRVLAIIVAELFGVAETIQTLILNSAHEKA